jgi:rRNA small subunit pseudouridine methyltransferase Nep1
VKLRPYLATLPETHSIAIFVGAMARGRDDFADAVVDEKIGISSYPLSASVACGKVRSAAACARERWLMCRAQFCCALEDLWDIL